MKQKIFLFLVFATVALFFIFTESQQPKHSSAPLNSESLEIFNGAPPFLNIAFKYPKSWKILVSRAKGMEEATVQMIGPRDFNHQFSTSFAVIGKKKTADILLENEAEELVGRNKALNQFKIVSKGAVQIAGQNAQQVIFDFVINLPIGVQDAPPVIMREEVVLVARATLLYQVHFIGTLEQHRKNKPLFESLLKSLRFTK